MKKIVVLIVTTVFILAGCKKTEEVDLTSTDTTSPAPSNQELSLTIEQKQNATLFFYTSTGCPGCGSWGMPTFDNLSTEYAENVTPITIHIKYGDPYITDVSEAIANNRTGQFYTPQIHVNNTNCVRISGGYISNSGSLTTADSVIAAVTAQAPVASSGATFEINGDDITVRYGAAFHEATSGEYYVSAYLLEDSLYYNQVGASLNPSSNAAVVRHDDVIRLAINNGDIFGDIIPQTNLNAGEQYENEVTVSLDANWNKNQLKVATIIWKREGNYYTVINSSLSE